MCVESLGYFLLYAVECPAADEKYVFRVDVQVLLVGMLASAFGRDVHYRSLKQFEHTLLHAFAAHVAGD